MSRARKIERFFSQPFHVAEVFTGIAGQVRVAEGNHPRLQDDPATASDDHLPEQAFYMVGGIDEAFEKAKKMSAAA